MQFAYLGKTGVNISRISLGTMNFGKKCGKEEAKAIFNAAREGGVNLIDCANAYSDSQSERMLGKMLADCRDEFVLTSKVAMPMDETPLGRGLSRRHIMLQAEKSLARLGTDRIDIYYLHRFDPFTDMEESLRAMDDLVRQGKVLYVAVSNWSAWQTALGLGVCRQAGLSPICCVQPMYNLVKRQAEVEIFPLALHQGLGVMPYNPLAAGLLTGRYHDQQNASGRLTQDQEYAKRYADPVYFQTAKSFVDLARERGLDPAALAVAWVLGNPAVTSALAGPRTLAQMQTYLAAADIEMTPELWKELAALGPNPPMATDRNEERQ